MENRINSAFFEGMVFSERLRRDEYKPSHFYTLKKEIKLFLPNHEETIFYRMIKNDRWSMQINLGFARSVIADEHYPEKGELWYYPNGEIIKYEDPDGVYTNSEPLRWGRSTLVDMIGIFRYSEAMPELREVLLHDSYRMKMRVLKALVSLEEESADGLVLEFLKTSKDKKHVTLALHWIRQHSAKELFIDALVDKFEEYYLDHDPADASGLYRRAITQKILHICSMIPSIKSANLLEMAVGHPYGYVEKDAMNNISRWCYMILELKTTDKKLINRVLKFSKTYDPKYHGDKTWKKFQKIASPI